MGFNFRSQLSARQASPSSTKSNFFKGGINAMNLRKKIAAFLAFIMAFSTLAGLSVLADVAPQNIGIVPFASAVPHAQLAQGRIQLEAMEEAVEELQGAMATLAALFGAGAQPFEDGDTPALASGTVGAWRTAHLATVRGAAVSALAQLTAAHTLLTSGITLNGALSLVVANQTAANQLVIDLTAVWNGTTGHLAATPDDTDVNNSRDALWALANESGSIDDLMAALQTHIANASNPTHAEGVVPHVDWGLGGVLTGAGLPAHGFGAAINAGNSLTVLDLTGFVGTPVVTVTGGPAWLAHDVTAALGHPANLVVMNFSAGAGSVVTGNWPNVRITVSDGTTGYSYFVEFPLNVGGQANITIPVPTPTEGDALVTAIRFLGPSAFHTGTGGLAQTFYLFIPAPFLRPTSTSYVPLLNITLEGGASFRSASYTVPTGAVAPFAAATEHYGGLTTDRIVTASGGGEANLRPAITTHLINSNLLMVHNINPTNPANTGIIIPLYVTAVNAAALNSPLTVTVTGGVSDLAGAGVTRALPIASAVGAGIGHINVTGGAVDTIGRFDTSPARTISITESVPGSMTVLTPAANNPALRGLTLTMGDLGGPFRYHPGHTPTITFRGQNIPVYNTHAAAIHAVFGQDADVHLQGQPRIVNTVPGAGQVSVASLGDSIVMSLNPENAQVAARSYAFFSNNNTRLNIVLKSQGHNPGTQVYGAWAALGVVPSTMTIGNLRFQMDPTLTTPQFANNVALVLDSAIGDTTRTFGNNIRGQAYFSQNIVSWQEQRIVLDRNAPAGFGTPAGNVAEMIAGRIYAAGTTATTPNRVWTNYTPGAVGTIRLREGVGVVGALQASLAHNTFTFTLTDAEGTPLTSASIAGVRLNTNTNASGNGWSEAFYRNVPGIQTAEGTVHGTPWVIFPNANSMQLGGMVHQTGLPLTFHAQFAVNTAPDFNGAVYVQVDGAGFSGRELVANVTPAITVATNTTFVQLGSARVAVQDIVITETAAGRLRIGELFVDINQASEDGLEGEVLEGAQVRFHPIAQTNVVVTGHANVLNRVGVTVHGTHLTREDNNAVGFQKTLTITRASLGEPSVITLRDLSVVTGALTATGPRSVLVGGTSLLDNTPAGAFNAANFTGGRVYRTANAIATPYVIVGGASGSIHSMMSLVAGNPFVTVNGVPQPLVNQHGQPTPLRNDGAGRMMVPIRAIANLFGVEVTWLDMTSAGGPFEVWLMGAGVTAVFTVGSTTYTVNGVPTTGMLVAPFIPTEGLGANSMYLPIRYIANALGIPAANIGWDAATNTAWINNPAFAGN
jgi:hypothetical protein